MTATPRVYGEKAKSKAKTIADDALLCSMDDENLYGPEFFRLSFGQAVQQSLLSDYKVLILTTSEGEAKQELDRLVELQQSSESNYELQVDDVAKLLGCQRGLAKIGHSINAEGKWEDDFAADPEPMKRAVCFCSSIKMSKAIVEAINHLSSIIEENETDEASKKAIEELKEQPSETLFPLNKEEDAESTAVGALENGPRELRLSAEHIDGTIVSSDREELLNTLRSEPVPNTCRILSNVRCLSEGVDVPNLDAALFLSPRNSQVDVIQAVGRVMRRAEGKKYGYIILPIVISEGEDPVIALNNNERYKVVWQTLQAIRSHDDRFRIMINQLGVGESPSSISIIGTGSGGPDDSFVTGTVRPMLPGVLSPYEEAIKIKKAIYAQIVKRCGDRDYLDQWAKDVGNLTASRIEQIKERLANPTEEQQESYDTLLATLRSEVNPNIGKDQMVELLTQHITTLPVFDALFPEKAFARSNPVARQMECVVEAFHVELSEEEQKREAQFKADVAARIDGISTAQGRQAVIHKLYEQFFAQALPKMAEKLGVVYTPVEVVDYILRSVDFILQKEFHRRLTNPSVHILDPFTGTGTFIARLFETGLIEKKDIRQKYRDSLHANEIMLLAYYIAAVNIEETYHGQLAKNGQRQEKEYEPFPGIVLTDTFQSTEEEPVEAYFDDSFTEAANNKRLQKQRRQIIKVIIGNPPYSVGQKSGNDNNQNDKYPKLDTRIAETYVVRSNATNKNSLYDSYIKAFRWAADRLESNNDKDSEDNVRGGIIAFVSNGAFIDNSAMEGFRKSLMEEFSEIYVFNLRGNARTSGELRRKEKDNVFGQGTRTPVAITILVKKPSKPSAKVIHYCDIGDYLSREQKLQILRENGSVDGTDWEEIVPNEKGDWINQRNGDYDQFYSLGSKEKDNNASLTFFEPVYGRGICTCRDAWVYNFSFSQFIENMRKTITFFNEQVVKYSNSQKTLSPENFVTINPNLISWSRDLYSRVKSGTLISTKIEDYARISSYRPFCKENFYFNSLFLNCVYQIPKSYPHAKVQNIVLCINGSGIQKKFSVLMTNIIPDVQFMPNGQCFPLYYYEPYKGQSLFDGEEIVDGYVRHSAITNEMHVKCMQIFGSEVTKEDIFFYVYGALHSPEYRENYEAELKKELARLSLPKTAERFFYYSDLGRRLADIHVNYETGASTIKDRKGKKHPALEPYDLKVKMTGTANLTDEEIYRVNKKMKLGTKEIKEEDGTKRKVFTGTLQYNEHITFTSIPEQAFQYVVNGRSPLEWLAERYYVRTDKASGIVDDPNLWCKEHNDPKYIYNLVARLVAVAVETVKLTSFLPPLED